MSEPIAKVGMAPCHPGEFIRAEILNELRLPMARAAAILGVRRATLSDLVNGKAGLSPVMALRIEKAFGVSMDTLLRTQARHDSHAMRQGAAEIDVKRYEPASACPAFSVHPWRNATVVVMMPLSTKSRDHLRGKEASEGATYEVKKVDEDYFTE